MRPTACFRLEEVRHRILADREGPGPQVCSAGGPGPQAAGTWRPDSCRLKVGAPGRGRSQTLAVPAVGTGGGPSNANGKNHAPLSVCDCIITAVTPARRPEVL